MDKPVCAISIVVPAYNEADNVAPLYASVRRVLDGMGRSYEIIFVDDGSSDSTLEVLEGIVRNRDSRTRVLKFRRNFGQTPAMAAGIDHARGEVIVTLDADLQNDPGDIPRLLEKIDEGYDIVSGWRKDRKDKALTRKVPSVIANRMIARMTGVHIHDYGCTLKAYRAAVIKDMHLYSDMHRFMAALGALSGARVTELAVRHHPRIHGVSKYGISRTFKVLMDVLTIKLILGYSNRPLHLFGFIALGPFAGSAFFAVQSLVLYYRHPPLESTPVVFPTIALMLASLGMFILGLGILGELILKLSAFRRKAQC